MNNTVGSETTVLAVSPQNNKVLSYITDSIGKRRTINMNNPVYVKYIVSDIIIPPPAAIIP